MLKGLLGSSAPVIASAGLYGIDNSQLGMALLIIMALAVIANQLFALFEKIRSQIRSPEISVAGLASAELCEQKHEQIAHDLAAIKAENERQDRVTKDQFQAVAVALGELRRELKDDRAEIRKEFREDVIGLRKLHENVLSLVSRLEGKVGK